MQGGAGRHRYVYVHFLQPGDFTELMSINACIALSSSWFIKPRLPLIVTLTSVMPDISEKLALAGKLDGNRLRTCARQPGCRLP